MFFLVLFLVVINVFSQTANTIQLANSCWVNCPSEMPSNIEYVGRGYDIFLGAPMANSVDTGFRAQVYDANDISGPQPNPSITIPKGFSAFDSLACQVSFTSKAVTSSSEYQSTVSQNANVDVSASGGFGGVSAGGSFSYSEDSQQTKSGMANSFFKYTYSIAFCEVYRAKLLMFEPPLLSAGFQTAVAALPATMTTDAEKGTYLDFVREFGTHIAYEVGFGSKLTYKKVFTSSSWQTITSSSTSVEIAASVSASVDVMGATADVSAGGGGGTGSSASAAQSLSQESTQVHMYSLGARPPADGNTATWAAEAALNPLPITYKLAQLNDYFYYDTNGVKQYLLPTEARANFPAAVALHLANLDAIYNPLQASSALYAVCDGKVFNDGLVSYCVKWMSADGQTSWYSARDSCLRWGGDLVTIRDDKKNNFVSNSFTSDAFWTGLNKLDKAKTTTWFWGRNAPVSYTSWQSGYPVAESVSPTFDCMYTNSAGVKTGTWYNTDCTTGRKFAMCERPFTPPPVPANIPTPTCTGTNTHEWNGQCIEVITTGKSYYDARTACQKWHPEWNSDIVQFSGSKTTSTNAHTSLLADIINNVAFPDYRAINFFWIGLTDLAQEGLFMWEDGEYLGAYAPFYPGYANTISENCVLAYANANAANGWWITHKCSLFYAPYVCQHDMTLAKDDDDFIEEDDDGDEYYDDDY